MIKFIHHLLNPHCPDCKADKEDASICNSCETLKLENARLTRENERLIDAILEKPKVIEKEEIDLSKTRPILPNNEHSWRIRRQMLEKEDRAKATAMKEAAKPLSDSQAMTIEDLEKEVKDANLRILQG